MATWWEILKKWGSGGWGLRGSGDGGEAQSQPQILANYKLTTKKRLALTPGAAQFSVDNTPQSEP